MDDNTLISSVPVSPKSFGPRQGVLLIIGMLLASMFGSALVGFIWGIQASALQAAHHVKPLHGLIKHLAATMPSWLVAISALSGSLLAAIWVFSYTLYAAGPYLQLGSAQDLAWRPSVAKGYGMAFILSMVALSVVILTSIIVPPNPKHLIGPVEQLGKLPGLSHLAFIVIAVLIAPITEELAFRGFLLASLARKYSVATAVTISTLVFVALHAPDKIHYWPGFIDVGVLALFAAYVRLKYQSLRPAMFLHFCYNGSILLLAGLAHK